MRTCGEDLANLLLCYLKRYTGSKQFKDLKKIHSAVSLDDALKQLSNSNFDVNYLKTCALGMEGCVLLQKSWNTLWKYYAQTEEFYTSSLYYHWKQDSRGPTIFYVGLKRVFLQQVLEPESK